MRSTHSLTTKLRSFETVKPLPKDFGVASRGSRGPRREGMPPSYDSETLGMQVADLTPEVAKQLGLGGYEGVNLMFTAIRSEALPPETVA